MATVSLAPVIKRQFSDSNGNPLAGGKIYTYQSGTSTPQATYVDSAGVTQNSNPIILDSSGEASIWLDVSLSYKFVVKDSTDVTLKTEDGIIGLLTNNSVPTAALQDSSVTTAKLADDSVTSAKLQDDTTIDANRAVTTNHIRNSAVTTKKLNITKLSMQKFTSGSGTYYPTNAFIVTSATVVAGDTYTNNGVIFTIAESSTATTIIYAFGNGSPASSGTLTRSTGTGDSTVTFSEFNPTKWIRVRMVGGGGGGGGGGSSGYGSGGSGGSTTFGGHTATGGGGGSGGSGAAPIAATGVLGSGAIGSIFVGGIGATTGVYGAVFQPGGLGGASMFGGGGPGQANGGTGYTGQAFGSGGGGGGTNASSASNQGGGGGNSGGGLDFVIKILAASYAYSVGAAGTGGTAGSNGSGGGVGAIGYIEVTEHYQ